jgi:hypothetical protein
MTRVPAAVAIFRRVEKGADLVTQLLSATLNNPISRE